jgi:hypothetical protein
VTRSHIGLTQLRMIRRGLAKHNMNEENEAQVRKLTRDELITVVRRLQNAEGTIEELEEMAYQFNCSVIHPAGIGLIYYPKSAYKPIVLPIQPPVEEESPDPGRI